MAKYGEFLYGAEVYGATAYTEGGEVIWIVVVDWDNDGVYDGTNEGGRLTNCTINRGRQNYLDGTGRGFDHMRVGTCSLTFDNYDRRYDPRYSSSTLYPNVKPGRKILVGVKIISTGDTEILFTGLIDNIVPDSGTGGDKYVTLQCVDYGQRLNDQQVTMTETLIETDLTNCMVELLSLAEYPGLTLLDIDTQPVPAFGVDNRSAAEVIHNLADAGLGTFFVDRNGKATFYARDHSGFTTHTIDEAQCQDRIEVTQPWEEVYNFTDVWCYRPIKLQPAVVYFLSSPVAVDASSTVTIYPRYDPATDLAVSTHAVNTASDGSGTALSSSISSYDLGRSGGTVVVSNDSGTAGYVTELEIRGRAWDVVEELYQDSDATSQAAYGKRIFELNSPYLQDPNYANTFDGVILAFAKDDREGLTIQIEQRPTVQYPIDLMDQVDFTSATLDIDDSYYVMGLEHEWNRETGQSTTTTLHLRKIIFDDTSITPALVEQQQWQAPLGHNNPGGDPETMESVYSTEEYGNFAPPAYIQLSGTTWEDLTVPGGFVNWGQGYSELNANWSGTNPLPLLMSNDEMYDDTNGSTQIIIKDAGIWHFEGWLTHYTDDWELAELEMQIVHYDTDGATVLSSSGRAHIYWNGVGGGPYVDITNITLHTSALFNIAENQIIKAYANWWDGQSSISMRGWRIAPNP